jgi:long-chain acyl-CoA synthetase
MTKVPDACAKLREKTLPGLLAERARGDAGSVALRSKALGIYRERTWLDYATLVARCAVGFAALGLGRGERLAIMGDVCEEWALCDLAAQSLGAITYGIYPTAAPAEVEYQMRHGGARIFVAEDQEYVDKILPVVDRLPDLDWIVVIDTAAMFAYEHPKLKSWKELMQRSAAPADPVAELERLAAAVDPRDPAFIVYTSGTTGHPKGALISHGKHLAAAHSFVDHYPLLAREAHRTVVYLPLCHVLGRDVAITLPLISHIVPHYGESIDALPQTLFEIAPTVLFTVPRYLQKFASQVLVGIANTSASKRAVYDAAMRVGRAFARRRWDGTSNPAARTVYGLMHAAAFRPILNKLGFDALELVICGGAPVPPETIALWQIWGVNVCEIYGQTETAGAIISGQQGPFPRPGDVGTAPSGWQIKLGDGNEILVSGGDLFEGYWRDDEATSQAFDAGGRLLTGDVGECTEGRLRIVDRARDFIVTAGGKTISPAYIENILRASPYLAEVVVFGHARKYLTALIEIDYDTVSDWARNTNIAYTGFTSLALHDAVRALIGTEIDRANGQLARVEQIKVFRILPKALDPEVEGEPVTPTRKVKRKLMVQRFETLIESMYDDSEDLRVARELGDLLQS